MINTCNAVIISLFSIRLIVIYILFLQKNYLHVIIAIVIIYKLGLLANRIVSRSNAKKS